MKRSLLFLFLITPFFVFSQSNNIKRLEQQRKQTLVEISETDKLLQTTKKNASTILGRIELLSGQIRARQEVVRLLAEEIEGITKEQARIESEIDILEDDLRSKQKRYAKALSGVQANRQSKNKLLFVLSGKSLSESYRRFHYLKEFTNWLGEQADEIKLKSDELMFKESELAKSKYEKVALLRQEGREHENLQREETNFQREANDVIKKQKELQRSLALKKKKADDLDAKIAKLIQEEIAKHEAPKGGKAGTSPAKGGGKPATAASRIDPTLSKNFAANRGKLPYPITGSPRIVSHFGTQLHKQWKVTTTSNGIDIQSQNGAEARAVFDGKVTKVIAFPGFNNCLIIMHGEYFSFYGNIKTVTVKQGDTVKTGQSLGTVYTDPDTNASMIHFQLWKGTTKLNPQPWIRR